MITIYQNKYQERRAKFLFLPKERQQFFFYLVPSLKTQTFCHLFLPSIMSNIILIQLYQQRISQIFSYTNDMTVFSLKRKLERTIGYPAHQQHLLLGGKI
jgi:hypothetical protein